MMDNDINKIVFTTNFILENKSPIIYVVHDNEGDWQFLGGEETDEKNGRIVTLGEILEMDPTIKDILWLPEGSEAWRSLTGGEWTTAIYTE